jgi:1-acyl-sn-glycerol-3-phosphate acyltransferase
MLSGALILALVMLWLLWAYFSNRVMALSIRGTIDSGVVMVCMRIYARIVHRLRVEGRERIPRDRVAGPMIVVCNHTAGVDPLLVQSACPFEITWTMAEDMRLPWAERFWEWSGILFMDRRGGGSRGARRALRVLAEGGVLGIFPEGRLEQPAGRLLAFHAGVGLLAVKSGARVLPIVIDGTPEVESAWESLWRRSRSRLRVQEPIVYDAGTRPSDVVRDLRSRFEEATGWPGAGAPEEER